ncbi:hypothetical protein AU106_gp200 [Sinorhizobium phage phiM9]|uniref:Uncharacterized protein n=1 Tax=Sinorhizobium phage phiM9 TaxID=1636182 RepID=A0A0F6THL5_9CAUD|nr:hypothetical protein AU106_gp200 [Sinorhizobium phage phiM9]AKE44831.1 hypothetical protein Sm_phiM9_204 [Sinorhizobium phage phiM9]
MIDPNKQSMQLQKSTAELLAAFWLSPFLFWSMFTR